MMLKVPSIFARIKFFHLESDITRQVLAVVAFVMVSCVVKVFEAMTKSVLSGSHFLSVSAMWVPSMLETKWTLGPTRNGFKASVTIRGPRSVVG